MNYHKIATDNIINGENLRVVLWVSGCTLGCPHCFNPETWDFHSGMLFTSDTLSEIISKLDKPYIDGLTLTGGNPLESENLPCVCEIVKAIRDTYGDKKTIWIYTGYTWDELCAFTQFEHKYRTWGDKLLMYGILSCTDVVADGRYVDSLSDVNFPYRGSTNQRLIDVKASSGSHHEQYFKVEDMVEYRV